MSDTMQKFQDILPEDPETKKLMDDLEAEAKTTPAFVDEIVANKQAKNDLVTNAVEPATRILPSEGEYTHLPDISVSKDASRAIPQPDFQDMQPILPPEKHGPQPK